MPSEFNVTVQLEGLELLGEQSNAGRTHASQGMDTGITRVSMASQRLQRRLTISGRMCRHFFLVATFGVFSRAHFFAMSSVLTIERVRLNLLQVVQHTERAAFFPALIKVTEWQQLSGGNTALNLEQSLQLVDLLVAAASVVPSQEHKQSRDKEQAVDQDARQVEHKQVAGADSSSKATISKKRKATASSEDTVWWNWAADGIEMAVPHDCLRTTTEVPVPVLYVRRRNGKAEDGRPRSVLHLRSPQALSRLEFIDGSQRLQLSCSQVQSSLHSSKERPFVYRAFFQDNGRWMGLLTVLCHFADGKRQVVSFFREVLPARRFSVAQYKERVARTVSLQTKQHSDNMKLAAELAEGGLDTLAKVALTKP